MVLFVRCFRMVFCCMLFSVRCVFVKRFCMELLYVVLHDVFVWWCLVWCFLYDVLYAVVVACSCLYGACLYDVVCVVRVFCMVLL